MIKAVLILGLAAIASAQVLRISPVVIGQTQPGQQQVIHLAAGGGLGSAPHVRREQAQAVRPAPYQVQPAQAVRPAPYQVQPAQVQPSHVKPVQVRPVQVRPVAVVAAQPVARYQAAPVQVQAAPAYSAPSYAAPSHAAPSYAAPSHAAPSYAAPARYEAEEKFQPQPYAFGFESEDEYQTKIGRQESANEQGIVTGSYTLSDANGVARIVEYVADENGFRATVRTNEPGTLTSEPADVKIESSAAPTRR